MIQCSKCQYTMSRVYWNQEEKGNSVITEREYVCTNCGEVTTSVTTRKINRDGKIHDNHNLQEHFPNGFQSWSETYCEICMILGGMSDIQIENTSLGVALKKEGKTAYHSIAMYLTDLFEKEYAQEDWQELDYYETIDEFVDVNLLDQNNLPNHLGGVDG